MSLSRDRAEILELATKLRPVQFEERLDYWRKGGLPAGGGGEQVSRSRTPSMPSLDRIDRELQEAQRAYRDDLNDARRLLAHAAALEVKYLFKIDIAPEALQNLVSDEPSCVACGAVKQRGKPWRLRTGKCDNCYEKARRKRLAELETMEGA